MPELQSTPTSARNDDSPTVIDLQKRHGKSALSALLVVKCEDRETSTDMLKALPRATISNSGEDVNVVPAEKPFPFMKLPPELRQMVYKELLVQSQDITISNRYWGFCFDTKIGVLEHTNKQVAHSPAATCQIFRASKACYNEAMPIYFGCNSFAFESLDLLLVLDKLRVDYRRNIKSLSVKFWGNSPAKSARLLRGCTALRQLSVEISYATLRYGKSEFLPLLNSNGINDLLKVRGITDLKVTKSDGCNRFLREMEGWEPFVEALQVLKQPCSAAALRYQYTKDYPPEKAKRIVFGKTNVMTRSERNLTKNAGKEQEGTDPSSD
ncbi:MAG: hypothetical protein LQ343_006025 [Gyalolechia ehrenbergii]|nr:MAG: hypothetical protein LQ343_006025 [Gyalolechia ehrenbergii]